MQRNVYVISDLHLGGDHPTPDSPGFRMMTRPEVLAAFIRRLARSEGGTELVINGDFVDFLAESIPGEGWTPFQPDQDRACELFRSELKRDAVVFDALREFTDAGQTLTILLGNHDLELSFPKVRALLEEHVSPDHPIRFLYDGEAYQVGSALIEHGNRYDGYNVVDLGGLRAHRSSMSRNQPSKASFVPPPGSRIVAEVMNPLKRAYPFIDLLKPENAAFLALIAAIEPSVRGHAKRLAELTLEAIGKNRLDADRQPHRVGQVSSLGATSQDRVSTGGWQRTSAVDKASSATSALVDDGDPLDAIISALDKEDNVGKVGLRTTLSSAAGLLGLLAAKDYRLERRLPLVKLALRALEGDRTFDSTIEPRRTYEDAARALTAGGFTHVVFGHTHHACMVDLDGATYLNSGTWANLMRFPAPLRGKPPTDAEAAREAGDSTFNSASRNDWWLRRFVEDCASGNLAPYVTFRPTAVHLSVQDGNTSGRLVWLDPNTGEESTDAR